MEYMHMGAQTQLSSSMLFIIGLDIFGVLIGLVSLGTIFNVKKTLGGKIGTALNLLLGGIVFTLLAFGWTLLTVFNVVPSFASIDVHHLFMIIAMILLVFAAKSFAKLAKP